MPGRVMPRLFLITFDIPGARPGDKRYGDVDRGLRRLGALYKPLKQVRLLVSDKLPHRIGRRVRHYIGPVGSVTVLRIGRFSIVDIADPAVHSAIRSLIRQHGF